MGEITIVAEEYKSLVETSVRVKLFKDFVNNQKYTVSREECGQYLGFEVKEPGGDD